MSEQPAQAAGEKDGAWIPLDELTEMSELGEQQQPPTRARKARPRGADRTIKRKKD